MGNPCFMYKVIKGEVEAKLFDDQEIPGGWYDSPLAAKNATRSKSKKVTAHGDSHRSDKSSA